VTFILERVRAAIANGQIDNLNHDYFHLPVSPMYPFTVAAGYATGGAINLTQNADLGEHGMHLGFRIVSKNGHKGKNGITYDHVVFHMINIPGYGLDASAAGHYMHSSETNTIGYAGCMGRQYLLNNMLPALQALGIPFDQPWIKALPRRVSKGGANNNPGYDNIEDKLILPSEYEMSGTHTYSNSQAEAAADQGRWEYYDSDARRVKYDKGNAMKHCWLASPSAANASYFCNVISTGIAGHSSAHSGATPEYALLGFSPAFCVTAE
jgi:hypothetical protein